MKNFLYKHLQRVIGGFLAIILAMATGYVIGIIDPEYASDYYKSMKNSWK